MSKIVLFIGVRVLYIDCQLFSCDETVSAREKAARERHIVIESSLTTLTSHSERDETERQGAQRAASVRGSRG